MDNQDRINDLTKVINELEHNEAFNIVLKDKQKTVEFVDNNWHLINLDERNKLLELKYAKIAAESMIRTIEDYKKELKSLTDNKDNEKGYFYD